MLRTAMTSLLAVTIVGGSALAQGAGRNPTMVVAFGPGGGYDLWGRTVARHIGKYMPGNPTLVVQNMPGAGSYVGASYIYNIAPKDGSTLGIIARDAALGALTGAEGARFDPLKISWIGTPTTETNVCIANATAAVKSVDDLTKTQLILGDTGPGTGTRSYPNALNALLGYKFKLVSGFPSSSDVFLAMERGEVDGICESLDSVTGKRPDWISSGKVRILFYGGAEPNPHMKDHRFVMDLAKTEEQKKEIEFLYAGQGIGRPFVAPPGLAPETLAMLRSAFDKTMKDPDFLADAKGHDAEIKPVSGEKMQALVASIIDTPASILTLSKRLMSEN